MKISSLPRLYLSSPIERGAIITPIPEQSHYLINVLRLKNNDKVRIFNEESGEFIASITITSKKHCHLEALEVFRNNSTLPSLHLAQCIIKGDRMMQILDMATQIGITEITPIISVRTQIRTINQERYQKCLIESSEQSERLSVPQLNSVTALESFLKHNAPSKIFYANEMESEDNKLSSGLIWTQDKITIIIGPEGGFTDDEIEIMAKASNTHSISLGANVLRAETAAISLLAQIQLLRQ